MERRGGDDGGAVDSWYAKHEGKLPAAVCGALSETGVPDEADEWRMANGVIRYSQHAVWGCLVDRWLFDTVYGYAKDLDIIRYTTFSGGWCIFRY